MMGQLRDVDDGGVLDRGVPGVALAEGGAHVAVLSCGSVQ